MQGQSFERSGVAAVEPTCVTWRKTRRFKVKVSDVDNSIKIERICGPHRFELNFQVEL